MAKERVVRIRERDEQQAVVEWFRLRYRDELIFAIPNGGSRSPVEAYYMRLGGLLAGAPDLCVPCPKTPWHGLYVEMKAIDGRLSTVQANFINRLNAKGYLAVVCFGFEDAVSKITAYMESGKNAR